MGNNNNQNTEEAPKCGLINEFLWICAGVNRKVLRQCPSDHAKYAGIGGTILFTALMAMLSGGYAIYKVFEDQFTAVAFGVFWGLLIFNLDRFMVNTMYSDGTSKITKEELKGGMPRIILAIFLGIVISAPIELRIFHDKIQAQLVIDQGNTGKIIVGAYSDLQKQIDDLEVKKKALRDREDVLQILVDKKHQEYLDELTGKYTGHPGNGPEAKRLETVYLQKQKELDAMLHTDSITIDRYDHTISDIQKRLDEVRGNTKTVQKASCGLTSELVAMYNLSSFSVSPTLCLTRSLVTLLFVLIEIIPTLFKMMMVSGAYDDMMQTEAYKVRVRCNKTISDMNDEINTDINIRSAINQQKLDLESKMNEDMMNRLAQAQSDLITKAINLWQEQEMKNVENNPSQYINIKFQEIPNFEQQSESLKNQNEDSQETVNIESSKYNEDPNSAKDNKSDDNKSDKIDDSNKGGNTDNNQKISSDSSNIMDNLETVEPEQNKSLADNVKRTLEEPNLEKGESDVQKD